MSGANDRIRTDDLLITNELLYQLSYIGIWKEVTCLRKCADGVNPHLQDFALLRGLFDRRQPVQMQA